MKQVHIIGIDLAKHGFQLHGARSDGSVAFRKKLTREMVLGLPTSQARCLAPLANRMAHIAWAVDEEQGYL